MDYSFIIKDLNILTFLMAFILMGSWQLAKVIAKKDFEPKLVMSVNVVVAIAYVIVIMSFGLISNFWDMLKDVLVVLSASSIFDVLKAYGVVK
jgi:uncharacterized membrane protein